MRILITGASGAGKTTLAGRIANHFGVRSFDIDPVAFVDANWTKRPLAERLTMVHDIAAQEQWVVAACHLGWTGELLLRAEFVIGLDLPLHVLLWRVSRRYFRSRFATRSPIDIERLVKAHWLWNFSWYFRRYRPGLDLDREANLSRSATVATLRCYRYKTIELHRSQSVTWLTRQLTAIRIRWQPSSMQDPERLGQPP